MINLLAHVNDFNQPGQEQDHGWRMMGGPGMMGWWPMMGGGWFAGVFSLVIGVLIILVLAALFRWLWPKKTKEREKKK